MFKKNTLTVLAVIIFLAGFGTGWFLFREETETAPQIQIVEKHEGQSQFINPILECEQSSQYISKELRNFKKYVQDVIDKLVSDGKAKSIAVYFRDLNNGPVFEINKDEYFIPGSLLKIPILLGYLKEAEIDPSILDSKVKFEGADFKSVQFIKPPKELIKGQSYTIRELLYRMIVYSDNYAAWLLTKKDTVGFRERVYRDLGLNIPDKVEGAYMLNIKDNAIFFRVLFNASYLNKNMSNAALELLSKSEFSEGLVKGVPPGTIVAHKFGERSDNKEKQLHDCGIIYYPSYPYLLCVMTKGEDFNDLASAIAEVSRATYEEVDKQLKAFPVQSNIGR